MITVSVKQDGNHIVSLTIHGHAGYAEHGKDLICAAVSAIGFGLCNALDIMKTDCTIEILDDTISIVVNELNDITQVVLETGVIQLETVQEQAKKFLKVKKLEVSK